MDLLAGPETSHMGTRGRTNPEYVGPSLLPALALHAGIGSGRKAARLHHLAALSCGNASALQWKVPGSTHRPMLE